MCVVWGAGACRGCCCVLLLLQPPHRARCEAARQATVPGSLTCAHCPRCRRDPSVAAALGAAPPPLLPGRIGDPGPQLPPLHAG